MITPSPATEFRSVREALTLGKLVFATVALPAGAETRRVVKARFNGPRPEVQLRGTDRWVPLLRFERAE